VLHPEHLAGRISVEQGEAVKVAEEKYRLGQRFNRWTLLEKLPVRKRNTIWKVICDCGAIQVTAANNIYAGKSKMCRSCGAKNRWKNHPEGK
jgi:hypothetical protein